MKSIYNITKGQLITLWGFGVISAWVALFTESVGGFFYIVSISFILIFYTIGWRDSRKKK